ncbi:hypothetical protein G4V72_04445 [Acinetobacter sp. GC2]|uniref:hypothetical protein n=1 Tax=Acinetobacter lwoffii TaxID=28090 RepID=UPI0013DFB468|nr:hypothetical protein [Acinetobacter lwoffii]NGP40989.1 hypothetical protein [Acinetobacter lwoffii]
MKIKVNEGKLISGLDIPRLVREEVGFQFRTPPNGSYQGGSWVDFRLDEHEEEFTIGDLINPRYEFRLKPRTILINGIEVPAPFLPEEGELFYHASPECEKGYSKSMAHERNETTWQQFGAWRTEEEIKQVVAALRQVFGGSHDN